METEMNFAELLLSHGFEEIYQRNKNGFNPKDNFLGCSRNQPDAVLEKGNVQVHISLCGVLSSPSHEELLNNKELFDTMSVRYVNVLVDNKSIFKTFSGEVPGKEITEKIFL